MSQFYVNSVSASNLPSNVPTSFVTDSGTAVPAANILNVFTNQSSINLDNGIESTGSGNTTTVLLTNRMSGAVTTSNNTPTAIITFPMSATPGTYILDGNIAAYNSTDVAGAAYFFVSGVRSTGAAGVLIGFNFENEFEELAMNAADISVSISGNSIVISVTGIAGKTVDWNGLFTYRFVG